MNGSLSRSLCAALFGLALSLAPLAPHRGWAQTGLDDPLVWRLLSAPPAAAEERLSLAGKALLRVENADGQRDPRLIIDLLRVQADALEELGRISEAARVYARKGRIAAENGLTVDHDVLDFYQRAQDLHANAGDGLAAARMHSEARKLAATRAEGAEDQAPRHDVRLFYATDRARSGKPGPAGFYSHGRGALERGEVAVSIPRNHRRGQMEHPSLLRMEFGARLDRHVMLDAVAPLSRDAFYDRLHARLHGAGTRELLIYIHGFNVSFDTAMRRAAQIAFDLTYDGVPIVYSWPSRGTTFGYMADAASVRHSARNLSRFLDEVVAASGAEKIHLVAHSMGNRALTDALELMALRRGPDATAGPVFAEVLFAAPDVDAGLFGEMARTFRPLARRMTLYGSSEDVALEVSRRLHGDAPRAGEGGRTMSTYRGIDSVDMSAVGDDLMAHDYFAEDSAALLDMLTLIWRNAAPDQRCGLEPVETPSGRAWQLQPGLCSDRTLLVAVSALRAAGVTRLEQALAYLDALGAEIGLAAETRAIILRLFDDPAR